MEGCLVMLEIARDNLSRDWVVSSKEYELRIRGEYEHNICAP